MNKAVLAVMERIRTSLETMPRCLVDSIAEGHLMCLWEVTHTIDNSIKVSSPLDHRQDKAIQVLEVMVDSRDSRDGGNLVKKVSIVFGIVWRDLNAYSADA